MTLPDELFRLITGPNIVVLSTRTPADELQQFHVWAAAKDGAVLMTTTEGRPKHRNLMHDPRVSLLAMNGLDPYDNIQVRGTVTITPGGYELMQALSQHYRGQPFIEPTDVGPRVLVRLRDVAVA